MESFKHGCPVCGQHIEYTVDYCGKQIKCPSCGNMITFPALPPSRRVRSAALARMQRQHESMSAKAGGAKALKFLGTLYEFEHWKIVWQCLIPFIIIAGLVYGAKFVRTKFADDSSTSSAPVVQADPNAWKHMTEVTRADVAVQARLADVVRMKGQLDQARAQEMKCSNGSYPAATINRAHQIAEDAQQNLNRAQRAFDVAFENYTKLGGTMDYRAQLPR